MKNPLGIVLLLLLLVSPATGQQVGMGGVSDCSEVPIDAAAGEMWVFSGSFSSPTQLDLVDVLNDRLLQIDASTARYLDGTSSVIEKVITRAFGDFQPSAIATDRKNQRTWIQLVGGRFLELREDNALASTAKPTQLWGTQLEENARLVAVLRWAIMGDRLVGYGNFRMSDAELKTGFYVTNLKNTSDAEVVVSYPESHQALTWYRMGYPYVATVGNRGYVLNVDGDLSIGQIRREKSSDRFSLEWFAGLPEAVPSSVTLPTFTTPQDYIDLMEEVESMTIPAGLYGWNGRLYLLWRTKKADSQEWWLSEIDAESGVYLGQVKLPSTAEHVVVVPGPRYWALVDKGRIKGFGMQAVEGVTLIPSSMIENLSNNTDLCLQ